MRTYGRVHTAFWTDTKIRALSERGRTLAFYMLTSPHSNMVGAFLLPDAYVSDDLGWPVSEVTKTIRELIENGFCCRFKDGRHIAICKFLLYNPVESSGSGKSIARQFNQLPRDSALFETVQLLKKQLDRLPESFANDLEMIPGTTSTSTATSQEQAQSIARDFAPAKAVAVKVPIIGFNEFYQAYPKRVGKGAAEKAYRKAVMRADHSIIFAGACRHATATIGQDRQFIQHPATWLNADGWLDEIQPQTNGRTNGHLKPTATDQHLAGLASLHSSYGSPDESD